MAFPRCAFARFSALRCWIRFHHAAQARFAKMPFRLQRSMPFTAAALPDFSLSSRFATAITLRTDVSRLHCCAGAFSIAFLTSPRRADDCLPCLISLFASFATPLFAAADAASFSRLPDCRRSICRFAASAILPSLQGADAEVLSMVFSAVFARCDKEVKSSAHHHQRFTRAEPPFCVISPRYCAATARSFAAIPFALVRRMFHRRCPGVSEPKSAPSARCSMFPPFHDNFHLSRRPGKIKR